MGEIMKLTKDEIIYLCELLEDQKEYTEYNSVVEYHNELIEKLEDLL